MSGSPFLAALALHAAVAISPHEPLLERLRRASPNSSSAVSLAGDLIRKGDAAWLEQACSAEPGLYARAAMVFATALRKSPADSEGRIAAYWVTFQKDHIGRLGRDPGSWNRQSIAASADELLLDRAAVKTDKRFRAAVVAIIARSWNRSAGSDLRDLLLFEIDRASGIDFSESETIRRAWGVIDRTSQDRRIAYNAAACRFPRDSGGELVASIYSLPSDFIEPEDALRFLSAVRALSPGRPLMAFVDPLMAAEITDRAAELRVSLLNSRGRGYTPWPRDTLSLVRSPREEVGILVRPDSQLQGTRREDNFLGRELIDDLPGEYDDRWGHPRWSQSPVPFHNGQVLLDFARAWISLHALEPRILALLHEDRVPVASFQTLAGIARYIEAAQTAASELSRLYGRPIRWIHPLPARGDGPGEREEMESIGGGAGFDLDSYLTVLDRDGGQGSMAIVGSLDLGKELVARSSTDDLGRFLQGFHISGDPRQIRAKIVAEQESPRASRFSRYLELVARHLSGDGIPVLRLPMFLVPARLLENPTLDSDFLVTWNNVVVDSGDSGLHAEGFSNLFPEGDAEAKAVFSRAGCRLDLLPPLVASIIRNGGYRCASNHLRK